MYPESTDVEYQKNNMKSDILYSKKAAKTMSVMKETIL